MIRPEYFVIVHCVLFLCGGRVYSESKRETACLQLKELSCGGRFFNRIDTTCRGLGQIYKGDYRKNCSRNEGCTIQNTVCFAGICLCRLGLYFSPQQNACVKECHDYGDKMDIYKGAGIIGHNVKSLDVPSVERCFEVCVEEKSFTCVSVGIYEDQVCYLSKVGYLDVEEVEREIGLHDWSFAQRRCE